MSSTTETGNDQESFETRLKKLESIVETLENETPALQDALNAYEEGVQLAKSCLSELEKAELRVRTIRLEGS